MKHLTKIAFKIALVLALFLSLLSCDPCSDVDCQNGGICDDGICECDIQFTGPRCLQEVKPNTVVLESLIVGFLPSVDANGLPWDLTSNPDIYVLFYQDGGYVGRTNLLQNEEPRRTRTFTGGEIPFEMNPDIPVQVQIVDFDPPNDVELMVQTWFDPYRSGGGFPSQIIGDGVSISYNISYIHE